MEYKSPLPQQSHEHPQGGFDKKNPGQRKDGHKPQFQAGVSSSLSVYLNSSPNFTAGNIRLFLRNWEKITCDNEILS